jgi:hypothetical protein
MGTTLQPSTQKSIQNIRKQTEKDCLGWPLYIPTVNIIQDQQVVRKTWHKDRPHPCWEEFSQAKITKRWLRTTCARGLQHSTWTWKSVLQNTQVSPVKRGVKNKTGIYDCIGRTSSCWQNTAVNKATGSSSKRSRFRQNIRLQRPPCQRGNRYKITPKKY